MQKKDNKKIEEIAYSLNNDERKILPYLLEGKEIGEIQKLTDLSQEAVKRSLEFLQNKGLIELRFKERKIVDLDKNGVIYLKIGLPERRLADLVIQKKELEIDKISEMNKQEFTVAIGELKKLGIIGVYNKKIALVDKEKAIKKFPQEKFLEGLPKSFDEIDDEERKILKNLIKRKNIIKIARKIEFSYEPLRILRQVVKFLSESKINFINKVTPELIKNNGWRGKKFRYYDIKSKVPQAYYGKRHFYLAFLEEVRQKLLAYGFKEMTSSLIVNEFWNFDALFQPQHHIAREWSDTYVLKLDDEFSIEMPKELIVRVKKMHEEKWHYKWSEEKARQFILRPQGTVISALTLAKNPKKIGDFLERVKRKVVFEKYFAIARVFRPDVVDATHLTEFNQCEGIIIGKNLSFANLLGWLDKLAREISNAKEVKFKPDYYPFTEPSVEVNVKLGGEWLEVGGAGIFREELVKPLLGKYYRPELRVLAWGLGIDRLAMIKYNLSDIRDLFAKNLDVLREKPI